MKRTRIASLLAFALSIVFAGSVSAAPASKRIGTSVSSGRSASNSQVDHKVMKRVGPPGKGYVCSH